MSAVIEKIPYNEHNITIFKQIYSIINYIVKTL